MEIKIKSLKFDADQKLVAFIEKKLSRVEKFYEGLDVVDVTLSLGSDHDNKNVMIRTHVPGQEIVIERNAKSFEDAVTECADAIKEKLTRYKEKMIES